MCSCMEYCLQSTTAYYIFFIDWIVCRGDPFASQMTRGFPTFHDISSKSLFGYREILAVTLSRTEGIIQSNGAPFRQPTNSRNWRLFRNISKNIQTVEYKGIHTHNNTYTYIVIMILSRYSWAFVNILIFFAESYEQANDLDVPKTQHRVQHETIFYCIIYYYYIILPFKKWLLWMLYHIYVMYVGRY